MFPPKYKVINLVKCYEGQEQETKGVDNEGTYSEAAIILSHPIEET